MGLLPNIAADLQVSIPSAGLLISGYAVGVMVGAPLVTLLLSAQKPKTSLIALMILFVVGNLLSAIAPSYGTLLAARVLTSLSHGAFFGLGAMVAAKLVPPGKGASAVATMFMGLTVANIGGVPAATWLGVALGWRLALGATAILGAVAAIGLLLALPDGERGQPPSIVRDLKILARPTVIMALATTAFSAASMFTLYTYIAPVLGALTHASSGFVTAMLVMIGVGFTIGNMLSGRLADRALQPTLVGFLLALVVVNLAFPLFATTQVGVTIALLIWGAVTFGAATPAQMRVMQEAHEASGLASSVNIGAFNLGNAIGAAIGGAVLNAGLGYAWIAPVGGVMGLIAVLAALSNDRRPVLRDEGAS
nr:MFS transporter [Rhizobium rhizogenes]